MKKIALTLANIGKELNYVIDEDSEITALFVGKGKDEFRSRINFIHSKKNIKSRIKIKAVLYGESKFNFEGILKIIKGAVGTDTFLKVDCLLISEKAFARAVPSLEINESDVKGGHGATIGYLDEDQMHYLKSRGLNSKKAEELLVEAFINH